MPGHPRKARRAFAFTEVEFTRLYLLARTFKNDWSSISSHMNQRRKSDVEAALLSEAFYNFCRMRGLTPTGIAFKHHVAHHHDSNLGDHSMKRHFPGSMSRPLVKRNKSSTSSLFAGQSPEYVLDETGFQCRGCGCRKIGHACSAPFISSKESQEESNVHLKKERDSVQSHCVTSATILKIILRGAIFDPPLYAHFQDQSMVRHEVQGDSIEDIVPEEKQDIPDVRLLKTIPVISAFNFEQSILNL